MRNNIRGPVKLYADVTTTLPGWVHLGSAQLSSPFRSVADGWYYWELAYDHRIGFHRWFMRGPFETRKNAIFDAEGK